MLKIKKVVSLIIGLIWLTTGFLPYHSKAQAEDSLSRQVEDPVFQEYLVQFGKSIRESLDLEGLRASTDADFSRLDQENNRLYDTLQKMNEILTTFPVELPSPVEKKGRKKSKVQLERKDTLSGTASSDSLHPLQNEAHKVRRRKEDVSRKMLSNYEQLSKKEEQLEKIRMEQLQNSCSQSQLINSLRQTVKSKKGAVKFSFNNCRYIGYIVDHSKERIGLHWQNQSGKPFAYLSEVKSGIEKTVKKEIHMLTNAGMYTSDNAPKGLFIADGKIKMPLDSLRQNSSEPGVNFYLQPNGVFWIDQEGKSRIDKTEVFHLKNKSKPGKGPYPKVVAATQSGPMLVYNGQINRNFNNKSTNAKIRSGVGVTPDGQTIFLCTKGEETFYNFSLIFKCVFNCQDALFLDGAISRMHIPNANPDINAGPFGPIISVVER